MLSDLHLNKKHLSSFSSCRADLTGTDCPYELVVVPKEMIQGDYYTMSAAGVVMVRGEGVVMGEGRGSGHGEGKGRSAECEGEEMRAARRRRRNSEEHRGRVEWQSLVV